MEEGAPRPSLRTPSALTALLVLLAVAFALRVWLVLSWAGHLGDVLVIHRWAERLAEVGPMSFYEGVLAVYPALMYMYWPLGLAFDGSALDIMIKAQSIPFDLAIGVVLFVVVGRRAGAGPGLGAAALYLFNPAVLLAGPVWGQVDSAGTLLFMGALLALAGSRWAVAGALAMLAGLVKPQFGLVALPVAWMTIAAWRSGRGIGPVLRGALGAVAAYALVAAGLQLDPLRYVDQLYEIARFRPFVSAFAPNPWGVLVGFEIPDDGLAPIGAVLLMAGLAASLLPLRRRRDLPTLLAVGLFICFAFYFLPTRVHERYLFPAMALLVPFAAVSMRALGAYALLTAGFAASLVFALAHINSGSIPQPIREVIVTPAAVWAMGLALAGGAVLAVWLLLRGAGDRLSRSPG